MLGPRATMGNVQWTAAGVTATFMAPTTNVRHLPATTRLGPYHRWEALYTALGRPFTHTALHRQVPVSDVMRRMAAAVDGPVDRFPAWQERMAETRMLLEELPAPPTEKLTPLTVTLPVPTPAWTSAWWAMAARLDQPPPMPSVDERRRAHAAAAQLGDRLAGLMPGIRAATSGELLWLTRLAATFGGQEPDYTLPAFTEDPPAPRLLVPLADVQLRSSSGWRKPLVEITTEDQTVVQAFLVVSDFPREWDYPTSAVGDVLDDLDGVTTHVAARTVGNAQTKQALDKYFKHVAWVESEAEGDTTPHVDAVIAFEDLTRELAELAHHEGPSSPATIVLRCGATTPDALEEVVKRVRDRLDPAGVRFQRPRGWQRRLWAATLPGSALAHRLNRWARALHPKDLAGLGVFHGHELGDPDGRVYAFHDANRLRLIFRNPARGPRAAHGHAGATMGSVGDLGSGKSLPVKMDADQVLATGGGVFVPLDASREREWARAAHGFPVDPVVIDPTGRRFTFDPLRTFTANRVDDPDMRRLAEQHTLGFFAIRLGIPDEDDPRYDVLEAAVMDLLADDPPLPATSPNLLRLLRYRAGDPAMRADRVPDRRGKPDRRFAALTIPQQQEAAGLLATRLANLARSGARGRSIMGDGAPMNLAAPCVVISDPGVDLSSREGRASVYLSTAYALAFLHATPRFNLVPITELRVLAEDPFGLRLIDDVLTQSRRANAGVAADSQLVRHFRHPELLVERSAGQTRDEDAARAAAGFVGAPASPALIARLQTLDTAVKLYRDRYGRIGWADVLGPLDERRMLLFRADADALAIPADRVDAHLAAAHELRSAAPGAHTPVGITA